MSLNDEKVRQNIGTYLLTGFPNMMIILLDWSCFECSGLIAGLIGVKEQALYTLFNNLLAVTFGIAFGLQ